ncbi:hypothetical protein QN277_026069 [Acacia crassicarpa]|uniref:Uncharacterized protein n=1 Tax=Acacia crassicarpa TaxID=499986 RepID=A0AAE1J6V0_9FABA|nr:hypothetical protein QN277_026069 [Acacia crassicarpa]
MEFQYFPRNYDGRHHSGWNPSSTGYDSDGGVSRHCHQPKHHVAFKAEEEEIISRNNSSSNIVLPQENVGVYNRDPIHAPNKSVDDEADAFIKHEHNRIRLARLRSINPY